MKSDGPRLAKRVHFHVVVIDGVYDETASEFSAAEPPDAITLRTFLERLHARVWKWAKRRAERYAKEGARDANGFESLGIQRGLFATLDERGRPIDRDDDDEFDPKRVPGQADRHEGFSVHTGVTVAAGDRAGRERLCRYGARPPFSLERASVLDDGRIAYRTKYPGPYGHTHRVMTPVEFLARLAALIPPPRYPLIHYHGVLAPNSKLRTRVVPSRGRERPSAQCLVGRSPPPANDGTNATPRPDRTPADDIILAPAAESEATPGDVRFAALPSETRSDRRKMHRIDWAELLRRIHRVDALACPRCEGRLAFIAAVTQRNSIGQILEHLGESATGPPPPRVVDPWAYG